MITISKSETKCGALRNLRPLCGYDRNYEFVDAVTPAVATLAAGHSVVVGDYIEMNFGVGLGLTTALLV